MAAADEIERILILLDRLEELREDLEDLALSGGVPTGDMTLEDLAAEQQALGVSTIDEIERRIAALNAWIDDAEARS